MVSLKTRFCGVDFENPFILPSGIMNEVHEHVRAINAGCGGVTLKTLTFERRDGNPLPRMWKYDSGFINSVGLRNAGIEKGSEEIGKFLQDNQNKVPIIVSLFATKVKEFIFLVEKIVPLGPQLIELNLSCPNVEDEFGRPLGMEKGAAEQIVKEVKKISGKVPVIAKLSPNVTNISEIAKACESGGADGIAAINTLGPGMLIDTVKRKPYLGAGKGGVSGPAIFPVTVRCVYEIYEAVKIPILGMGGVTKIDDVIQIIMAGASLVGIGSATYIKGLKIFSELKSELLMYMEKNNLNKISDIVGVAHDK